MTDLSSQTPGPPPDGSHAPDAGDPGTGKHGAAHTGAGNAGVAGQKPSGGRDAQGEHDELGEQVPRQAPEPAPEQSTEQDAAQATEQPAARHPQAPILPVFVDDPIVPLRLRLPGTIRHTLYHPGWFAIEEGADSQAFLGVPGEALYGFERLTHLVDYMRTHTPTGLAPGPDLAEVESWTADEYARRLCDYDLVAIPELSNGELSADEQGSVGSMLAVGLDLLDFLRVGGEHADALRQDPDISKLASGDEVLSIFAAGRHRQHVVEMIEQHWGPCMAAVAARTTAPRAER